MRKIIFSHILLMTFSLTLSGCNFQRNMLYYPSAFVPSPAFLAAQNLQFWPSKTNYRGFISTVQAGKVKGTIIVFHGNAGTASDRLYYVNALTRLGYRVLLAEYPGYGERKGELGEESFAQDAKETLRLAFEQYGSPLFLVGESLGCGVAGAVVKGSPVKIEGMILITPWDTLLSVAKTHYPWLPVRLFLKDKYDTIANLKGYMGRIAIIGAERDDIVPIRHAQALSASLSGFHQMFTIKGAGHNDWPGMVGPAWWKEITEFMQGNTL